MKPLVYILCVTSCVLVVKSEAIAADFAMGSRCDKDSLRRTINSLSPRYSGQIFDKRVKIWSDPNQPNSLPPYQAEQKMFNMTWKALNQECEAMAGKSNCKARASHLPWAEWEIPTKAYVYLCRRDVWESMLGTRTVNPGMPSINPYLSKEDASVPDRVRRDRICRARNDKAVMNDVPAFLLDKCPIESAMEEDLHKNDFFYTRPELRGPNGGAAY